MPGVHSSRLEVVAYVGLDWSDRSHAGCLQSVGSDEVEPFLLQPRPESLHEWIRGLRQRFRGQKVAVALEQSRGALIYALMTYEFLVLYPINPKALARYRETFRLSGAKDDPSDAELLLDLVRTHAGRLKAWKPGDEKTRALQLLVEQRRKLVNDRTRLRNRLTSLLKEYFPQVLEWCGEMRSPQVCDFLLRWPSLQAAQKARPTELRRFFRGHRRRDGKSPEERVQEIREAIPLTDDGAILLSHQLAVQAVARHLSGLVEGIKHFDQEIERLFEAHPDREIFQSFPGAGKILSPRLLAAFGAERDRFNSAQEVQQFSGIAPVTVRSGKSCRISRRRACPAFVKQSFHEFAEESIKWSRWARAYYDQQRSRGNRHHSAVRSLAFKWIRIMYRCWKNQTPYQEEIYLNTLHHRNPSLWSLAEAR